MIEAEDFKVMALLLNREVNTKDNREILIELKKRVVTNHVKVAKRIVKKRGGKVNTLTLQ